MQYKIHGNDMQYVEAILAPNETIVAETGAMMSMQDGIQMDTKFTDGSKRNSGLFGSLMGAGKRVMMGEDLFLSFFENKVNFERSICFSAPYPGTVIATNLQEIGGKLLCQKEAFLCCEKGVSVGIGFSKRLSTGFFGGEGFILQKLEGVGTSFIHAGGSVQMMELQRGEVLYVDSGSVLAFSGSVDFNIQMVKGVKNILFGGESLFLSTLTGPGIVYVQSSPYSRIINNIFDKIGKYAKKKNKN